MGAVTMKALLVVSEGFEDLEAFTLGSILRKGGAHVAIASLSSGWLTSTSGIHISADKRISEVAADDYDILIIVSSDGMQNSNRLISLIKQFDAQKKVIAATARAPLILSKSGILENRISTVYPGLESGIPRPRDAKIVIDRNVMTSRCPVDSLELAFKIIELFYGKPAANKLRQKTGAYSETTK
jgi:4-methyl-5(b-hydroxyethyl)-thiazole monophosphate biosynthesis